MVKDDYQSLARTASRETFIAACRFPFLIGTQALTKPSKPGRTLLVTPILRDELLKARPGREPPTPPADLRLFAVRKVQAAFASMITIGRTGNNDIVIADVQISKFHAFFKIQDDGSLTLADAGSRNGTFVADKRLEVKVDVPVKSGARIRFGTLEYELLDAGPCWDRLRR